MKNRRLEPIPETLYKQLQIALSEPSKALQHQRALAVIDGWFNPRNKTSVSGATVGQYLPARVAAVLEDALLGSMATVATKSASEILRIRGIKSHYYEIIRQGCEKWREDLQTDLTRPKE